MVRSKYLIAFSRLVRAQHATHVQRSPHGHGHGHAAVIRGATRRKADCLLLGQQSGSREQSNYCLFVVVAAQLQVRAADSSTGRRLYRNLLSIRARRHCQKAFLSSLRKANAAAVGRDWCGEHYLISSFRVWPTRSCAFVYNDRHFGKWVQRTAQRRTGPHRSSAQRDATQPNATQRNRHQRNAHQTTDDAPTEYLVMEIVSLGHAGIDVPGRIRYVLLSTQVLGIRTYNIPVVCTPLLLLRHGAAVLCMMTPVCLVCTCRCLTSTGMSRTRT